MLITQEQLDQIVSLPTPEARKAAFINVLREDNKDAIDRGKRLPSLNPFSSLLFKRDV